MLWDARSISVSMALRHNTSVNQRKNTKRRFRKWEIAQKQAKALRKCLLQ